MPSIADVVDHVQRAGLPLLFLDTCILLDVIRAPLRLNQHPGCVEAAQELLQLASLLPIRCMMAVGSFVRREWLAYSGLEADNLRVHLARVDTEARNVHLFCNLMGISPSFPSSEYRLLPLADRLHDLSRGLLDAALHLDPDNDCIIRAHGRATNNLAPSLKGGEIEDSTMTEECLEVSRRLHGLGYSRKRVFCTSNVADYCERGSARLHRSLAADFAAANLHIATNLPWAVNEIKKP
jgi:hypothetical protein